MKTSVGVLTFHRSDNYGALLQAYSLCRVLQRLGAEPEIVDYRCHSIDQGSQRRLLPPLHKNPSVWVQKCRQYPYLKRSKRACEEFREKYMAIGSPCRSDEDRADAEKAFHLILTGSDQVWNPILTQGKDDWYAFKRSGDSSVLASYAASAGSPDIFKYYSRYYEEDLKKYDMISVREAGTQKYLEKRLQRQIYHSLDPTLLTEPKDWEALLTEKRCGTKPYLFYYDVKPSERARELAEGIAGKRGLQLVHFSLKLLGQKNCIYAQDADPREFLGLIKNADAVVTSSYHGTVFSVLFGKPFYSVPHARNGERIRELLKNLHLEQHMVLGQAADGDRSVKDELPYTEANTILDEARKKSMEYLQLCIHLAAERAQRRT